MGTRLRKNPERTFNWFFEASCPLAKDREPEVRFQFPEDSYEEESNRTIPSFCFPYDTQRVKDGVAVQHFTFALTDLEGHQRFGFCRLASSTHTCLCIVSYLPWFEVFYKLLNSLADNLTKGQTKELNVLLTALYQQPVPLPSGSVTLKMLAVFFSEGEQLSGSIAVSHPAGHLLGEEGRPLDGALCSIIFGFEQLLQVPYFIAPDPRSLPSIPENRNLTELIVAVDVRNLLLLYASMLFERRILIFASKLSALTSCVHALSALLYPMYWQHIFIPVLPPHLLDYCCAPMPYLIGVHTSLSETVSSRGLEEVVTFNVDSNMLETPFDDFRNIPADVMSALKTCLKRQAVSPGCGVSRAFMRAQALLFGSYRDALQGHTTGELRFSTELFLDNRSPGMRQFLQSAVHLQFFKQFIDDRLDLLTSGKEPDDLFEEELLMTETADKNKPYQQIVGNLKKGGGALILNMKSKANTKAKALSRSGFKNLLPHKARQQKYNLHRRGSVSDHLSQSDCLQNRMPVKQHFGMSRPPRPVHKSHDTQDNDDSEAEDSWKGAVSSPVDDSDPTDEENSPLSDPEEMDLLGEIFDTLSSRSMHERGHLYGTRSLDLFGPDSYDYVTKHGSVHPSQESLSASVSSYDFTDSWHAETTDLVEDLDSLSLDMSAHEQEVAKSQTEEQEKREEESRWPEEEDNTVPGVEENNIDISEDPHRVTPEQLPHDQFIEKELEETQQRAESPDIQIVEVNEQHAEDNQSVDEQQEQEKTSTVPPHQGNQKKKVEQDVKIYPKVVSAVESFSPPASSQGFGLKLRSTSTSETNKPYNRLDAKNFSGEEDEAPPVVRVSELKKRFEAK